MNILDRWEEIDPILEQALDLPSSEIKPYLDRACGNDTDLRQKVEALLAVSTEAAALVDEAFAHCSTFFHPGFYLDHYQIVRVINPGLMGVVYLAEDTELKRSVALKVLPASVAARYPNEHQKLAKLKHENIATLYGKGTTPDGSPYFTMEYIEGTTITNYCAIHGLPVEDRLQLFQQVCAAVRHAHKRDIVHCDLKPENILVTDDGKVKLLDFGIARILSETDQSTSPSGYGGRAMTLPFASPEQVAQNEIGPPSDIYSLGIILCLLISEELPYSAKNDDELAAAIQDHLVLKPSDIASKERADELRGDLDALVLHCLEENPDQRFDSPQGISLEIDNYLGGFPLTIREQSLPYTWGKFFGRNRLKSIITAVFALIVLVVAVGWIRAHQESIRASVRAELDKAEADELDTFINNAIPLYNKDNVYDYQKFLDQTTDAVLKSVKQPEPLVNLLNDLGIAYQNAGLWDGAVRCHEKALQIARTKLGPRSALTADALGYLGIIARRNWENTKAEKLLSEAIGIYKTQVPETDSSFTTLNFQLAEVFAQEGRYPEAEALHRRLLALRRAASPLDKEGVAQSLFGVAAILAEMNKNLDEAEKYLQESLSLRHEQVPEGHPFNTNVLSIRAAILADRGEWAEAVKLRQETATMYREAYGKNHDQTITGDANLGRALIGLGNYDDATKILDDAGERAKRYLGIEHPETSLIFTQLARAQLSQKKPADAERLAQQAYEWSLHSSKRNPFIIARVAIVQGECFEALGRYDLAKASYAEALDILRHLQGDDTDLVLQVLTKQGNLLSSLGRFTEAEPILLNVFHRVPGRRDNLEALIHLYAAWHRPEMATVYQRLLEQLPDRLPKTASRIPGFPSPEKPVSGTP